MKSDQFCSKCGAGVVSRDGNAMTVRVQRGYPFAPPCDECERRSREGMRNLGQKVAKEANERVMSAIFGK